MNGPMDEFERIISHSSVHSSARSISLSGEVGTKDDVSAKLIIVMVGLPARGKSYVTKKLCRYLNWLQHETKIFNVGDRRRKLGQPQIDNVSPLGTLPVPPAHSASFFDPENAEGSLLREQAAMETLEELLHYLLDDGGSVAIFDATNSSIERRSLIMQKVKKRAPQLPVMFLESQCYDQEVFLPSSIRSIS